MKLRNVTLTAMQTDSKGFNDLQNRLKRTVGNRVARTRADLKYSQPDLLAELEKYGLARTQGSISQIETGKRLPSVEMLYVIARFLDTSTDYLLGLTTNELSAADVEEELAAASGEGKINKLMRNLPPDEQRQVLRFAEFLLSNRSSGNPNHDSADSLTEEEQLAREATQLLDSIERGRGLETRQEIEQVFRDKHLPVNRAT